MKYNLSITGTLRQVRSEKFSMIYMEVTRQGKPSDLKQSVRWHLEDEQRPTVALCGFALHDAAKSVSPALAMFGVPCKECKAIVSEYLFAPKEEPTRIRRFNDLIMSDVRFRESVTKQVNPLLLAANLAVPHEPAAHKPKTSSKKRNKQSAKTKE